MARHVLVVNGPNLGRLGVRQPDDLRVLLHVERHAHEQGEVAADELLGQLLQLVEHREKMLGV